MTNDLGRNGDHQGYTYDEAQAIAQARGEQAIPTFCAMCGPTAGCGVYAFVKNGEFLHVAGMTECPINRGGLCAKGQAAPEWVYSPDRLKQPLLRSGPKGSGEFQPISWDDAIGIIVEKLQEQKKRYGPESLAFLSPARRSYSEFIQRFLIVHGSPITATAGSVRCSARFLSAIRWVACRSAITETVI